MMKIKQRIMFCLILILCFFIFVKPLFAVTLTAEAVSQDTYWLALVHYRPTLWGGYKSSIDSDSFFLAADGKTNPISELQATVELFENAKGDVSKKCLFPARYMYLKEQGLIQAKFPDCPEYEQFKTDLNPAGITLLYTDAYMSNPSSLFGHTLMRIDVPEGKTQLVAHGMNYGAYVDENTAGALYAIYGLTGGYYGGFTVKPYYQIINTYNNMENRDIWEYTLNWTSLERDYFVAHLWEVGHTQTRYYFLTKNCSYLLMEVMDAIRPSLKMADDFPLQTIPLDTIKAVNKRSEFVQNVHYRPSRQKRITYRYEQMIVAEQKALVTYLETGEKDKINKLPEKGQIAVWDAAYEYVQYQWVKQAIPLKEYRGKSFEILRHRRNIATVSPEVNVPGENPINAHDSMRISASIGTNHGEVFEEIGWRAAYHSLTENPTGLLLGAEINFLDTVFRYKPQTQKAKLQKMDIVKITSLAPYNALFHPISYQIDTGIYRKWDPKKNREKLVYRLKGGSGLTFNPVSRLYVYGLVNTAFEYGGGFYRHPMGVGIGFSGGFMYYFPRIQVQVEGIRDFSDNRMMNTTQYNARVNYTIARNWSISTSYLFENQKYHSDNTFKISLNKYF